jgi:hypothetical protein
METGLLTWRISKFIRIRFKKRKRKVPNKKIRLPRSKPNINRKRLLRKMKVPNNHTSRFPQKSNFSSENQNVRACKIVP